MVGVVDLKSVHGVRRGFLFVCGYFYPARGRVFSTVGVKALRGGLQLGTFALDCMSCPKGDDC